MRRLRKVIFHNGGWKLLALAISIVLWSTYMREPFAQVAYNVPIAFVNVPAGLVIGSDTPTAVHVVLRGRSGLLRGLAPGDLDFSVDLTQGRAGADQVWVTPEMVKVPYGTEVVEITPARVHLTLVTDASRLPTPE